MARIVCLANSYKRGGRCVAGIHLASKKWIRPIGSGDEGAVGNERLIDGTEPQLLDILDIPIGSVADNLGCQPENVVLNAGKWHKVGKMDKSEISNYIENTETFVLHNRDKKVALSDFSDLIPLERWKSLQLIHVKGACIVKNPWDKLQCSFKYNNVVYTLPSTCPEAANHVGNRCDFILTISLGGPYKKNQEDPLYCWKMVAGVICLDESR